MFVSFELGNALLVVPSMQITSLVGRSVMKVKVIFPKDIR